MGRARSRTAGTAGSSAARFDSATSREPEHPQELTLYHGTSAVRASAIRYGGFHGEQVFLTSSRKLAGDYADGVVLRVHTKMRNPLSFDAADGPIAEQLAKLNIPFQASGGYLGFSTITALTAAGYDALIISYPADKSDPSDPQPARTIVRVFEPSGLTVLG